MDTSPGKGGAEQALCPAERAVWPELGRPVEAECPLWGSPAVLCRVQSGI